MDSEERKKLCWECGGEVPFESDQCPFCGAEFDKEAQLTQFMETPYSSSNPHMDAPEETLVGDSTPEPLYDPIFSDNSSMDAHRSSEVPIYPPSAEAQEDLETLQKSASSKSQMVSLGLLLPGLALLLFGLGMVFFSQDGQFTLRWDASYGLFVFTLSALCIYFGVRAFRRIDKK